MLLRLNMVLVQKNAYSRSIMMQLLNLMHQRDNKLPMWQMFSKSTAVYNEEIGEISFSILSRVVLGDTTKCSFKHMNILYGLIHTYRANNEDMTREQSRTARKHMRFDISKKHDSLDAVKSFILHMIREVKADTYRVYSGKAHKANPAYLDASAASSRKTERKEVMTFWERSTTITLNKQLYTMMKQAKATYFGTWAGTNCVEQWPEMKYFGSGAYAAAVDPAGLLENDEDGEDVPVVADDEGANESSEGEDPPDLGDDTPSDDDHILVSSEEDVYNPEHGSWPPTRHPEEEEKMPEPVVPRRGRPPGRRGFGRKRGKK